MPPPAPDAGTNPASTFAAFGVRNYRLFAGGFLCSATGLQMQAIAVLWEVYQRTQDPLHLGYVGLARALPVVLLALVAGHIADILNRRLILLVTQLGFALCAGGLVAASLLQAPLWVFYALLVATGVARAFNGPSRSSLLPLLVPDRFFQNAVTWNANIFQVAAIGGPLWAGMMIAGVGAAWPVYGVSALGALALSATMAFARPAPQAPASHGFEVREFLAGARHIWRERTIFGAISLDMFAVLLGGATALLPIYAQDILHVGPVGLGALRAGPFVGALMMGLYLAHRPRFRRAGASLLWSVAIFGVCIIVFGYSTSFWVALAALLVSGAADQVSVVIRHVLVQTRTPDALRGRVSAVNSMFVEVSNELGAFESGLVAKFFGPVFSVVSGGVGTLIVVAGVAAGVPQLRRLGDVHERTPGAPETATLPDAAQAEGTPTPAARSDGPARGSTTAR
jgi:MFS family permease